jgi:alkylated DNA repair protein (DNA oxidative demethylase)
MNLFSQLATEPTYEEIFPGSVLMRGLALEQDVELFAAAQWIMEQSPLHHATTPSGLTMKVMVTDCGARRTAPNRWNPAQPDKPRVRPPMPEVLHAFAVHCAARAGFPRFKPDACHINRYQAGTKLGLHQDKHECDMSQPIVSLSFGLECVFLLGGIERTEKPKHILLEHGDVLVWGGLSRMRFHGVQPVKPGLHPMTGPYRYNLTFRKVT